MTEHFIIIPGRAYSGWARSSGHYKANIRKIADSRIAVPFVHERLYVRVDYFYHGKNRVDEDNVLKSICDGLEGVAYEDDSQIEHLDIRRYNIDLPFRIVEPTNDEIWDWVVKKVEFVAVTVRIM